MSEHVSDLNKVIKLPIDSLRTFDVVVDQFADLGVLFENTVVLQPSNAAYEPTSGKMVLMAAPQNGWIEITFTLPITHFSCVLTSSQHSTLQAFDYEGKVVCEVETEKSAGDNVDPLFGGPPPNLPVVLQADNIHRVLLTTLDGQLVIHNVQFGF